MDSKALYLFDVDGTITYPRQGISLEMKQLLTELRKKANVGLVGGSDFKKIAEQAGGGGDVVTMYDYVFAENGLVAYKNGELLGKESILECIGEEKLQKFINFCLEYMSRLNLPCKRGNFVEFRSGLINICPVGRSCSQKEREEFAEYDKVHKVREKFVSYIKENFPDIGLCYIIGGQISFDCFPVGWDKTYCLKYLLNEGFSSIHFFGDKTFPGGNDYELFKHEAVIGHSVASPKDTMKLLEDMIHS